MFSIITFSLVANYTFSSRINFVLFTGITTMLLCGAFIACDLLGAQDNPTLALAELVVNGLWWLFWIASAASLADIVSHINGAGWVSTDASKIQASCAFAWLTWALWSLSTALSVKALISRRSSTPAAANMPTGTQSSVSMV